MEDFDDIRDDQIRIIGGRKSPLYRRLWVVVTAVLLVVAVAVVLLNFIGKGKDDIQQPQGSAVAPEEPAFFEPFEPVAEVVQMPLQTIGNSVDTLAHGFVEIKDLAAQVEQMLLLSGYRFKKFFFCHSCFLR